MSATPSSHLFFLVISLYPSLSPSLFLSDSFFTAHTTPLPDQQRLFQGYSEQTRAHHTSTTQPPGEGFATVLETLRTPRITATTTAKSSLPLSQFSKNAPAAPAAPEQAPASAAPAPPPEGELHGSPHNKKHFRVK